MSLIIDGTTIKKIVYNGNAIKKGYCNGSNVFTSDHIVTYQIKGQTWTAVVEDGENAATSAAATIANGKMGLGDTFLGWTTVNGSSLPQGTISATADNMILYGVWKHSHSGSNRVQAGCYQGAGTAYNPKRLTGGTGTVIEPCGCSWSDHYWHCDSCGRDYTTTTRRKNGCTQHNPTDDTSQACGCQGYTAYALSCGKSEGIFCG